MVTVVFVVDPSENPGAPLAKQFELREELKTRFPRHHWIDVVSKADDLCVTHTHTHTHIHTHTHTHIPTRTVLTRMLFSRATAKTRKMYKPS
jgi:GTP1/Obg family GTP-binding protein